MFNLKQFSVNNIAAIAIGFIGWLISHLIGADTATAAAVGTVLTFIAHHYFHLDTSGTATGDAGSAGLSGTDSSPGATGATSTNSTTGPTASPAPTGATAS